MLLSADWISGGPPFPSPPPAIYQKRYSSKRGGAIVGAGFDY